MNLNRLYNIFRSERLEREDVETYGRSTDESTKQTIEQKSLSDSFDADALEGWEQLSFNTTAMSNLDKKFAANSSSNGWITFAGGAILVGIIGTIIYFTAFNDPAPKDQLAAKDQAQKEEVQQERDIVLEQSDVVLPEPIEQMETVPKAQRFEPKEMIEDFKEMITFREQEIKLEVKDVRPDEIIPRPAPEIQLNHKAAKEIYLHNLKLVDYRLYRDRPAVKTRQMVLSGTPANKEDEYSEEEDPVWKDVDVPYIEYIDKSMQTFERGNYKKALSRFETIIETYSNDVNANFYAGVCLFNFGEYSQAIEHFDNCLLGPYSNFDEEALWMKAESLEKSGNTAKAKTIFKQIAEGSGFYSKQAKERLK